MKEIPVSSLKIGDFLSKDVFNDLGNIILSEGTEISEKHLLYFKKHRIEVVYVTDEKKHNELDNMAHLITDEKFRSLNSTYRSVLDAYKEIYFKLNSNQITNEDVEHLKSDLIPLIEEVLKDNDVLGSLRMVDVNEDYQLTHAINVSILCAMLGKWLGLSFEMIEQLALAGLLHDIGKSKISMAILNKREALTPAEIKIIQSHAQKGYEILKDKESLSKEVLAAVLFHHERIDGSGYPSGLVEEQIPYFARIVAVADVYDAVTSDRIYRDGVSAFTAFSIIKDESFTGLDPYISEVFLGNIAAFFINNRVKLSNGDVGYVVYVNKYALNRPLIRLDEDKFVDLASDYTLHIESVLLS